MTSSSGSPGPKEKVADEGIKICVEQIQELKEVKGVRGFHIMAIEWEEKSRNRRSGRPLSAAQSGLRNSLLVTRAGGDQGPRL